MPKLSTEAEAVLTAALNTTPVHETVPNANLRLILGNALLQAVTEIRSSEVYEEHGAHPLQVLSDIACNLIASVPDVNPRHERVAIKELLQDTAGRKERQTAQRENYSLLYASAQSSNTTQPFTYEQCSAIVDVVDALRTQGFKTTVRNVDIYLYRHVLFFPPALHLNRALVSRFNAAQEIAIDGGWVVATRAKALPIGPETQGIDIWVVLTASCEWLLKQPLLEHFQVLEDRVSLPGDPPTSELLNQRLLWGDITRNQPLCVSYRLVSMTASPP